MGRGQVISTDLFTYFSCSGICERRLKSIEVVTLLSSSEMHTAI